MKEENKWYPYIRKEGNWFVVGSKHDSEYNLILSKPELKRLKRKLSLMNIDRFWWKDEI